MSTTTEAEPPAARHWFCSGASAPVETHGKEGGVDIIQPVCNILNSFRGHKHPGGGVNVNVGHGDRIYGATKVNY
jgi:hypothetical protein